MKAKQKLCEAVDLLYSRGPTGSNGYARLLLECIRTNDFEQGKRLQSHMERHCFKPNDTFLQNRLLHLYAKCGKISSAQQLFVKMPQRDVFSWNAMLSLYSKLGLVENLRELFNRMPTRDSVSYNTVIAGFASCGCSEDALDFFLWMREEGFEPTEYTHVSILNACSQLLDLKLGKQIHGRLTASNLKMNVFVWNALIDMYAKCGEIDQARSLFNQMLDRNVVSWNSMIAGYLKSGQPGKCLDLFRQMQVLGVEPDLVTLSSVLGAYLQSGLVEEARRIFSEMNEKDRVCWTTMIVGYAQNGREEDALVLYSEMLSENVRPDSFTMSSVVSACAGLVSLDHGKVVHSQVILIGIEVDLRVSSALVDMYSKCGEITDAYDVFNRMATRNVVSWNAMIMGYAQNGMDKDALVLYDRMLKENLKPDNITFVGILSACSHASLIEDGQIYFNSISKLHGMKPTSDHYACMVNLLGRSGNVVEAVNLIKGMPDEPTSLIWSTLLSVCRINSDIKHAEIAARHLFELDPLDAGPYIMLSNMYAASGRWDDVASVRSLMKDRKIRKLAAYSWIEFNNKVHKFISDDRTHPQTEEIYRELSRLMVRLREEGFVPNTNLVLHDVGETEKVESICYHSEKLALAFGLIRKPRGAPIRIVKNIRVCSDCHLFMKFVSKVTDRHIVLRDSNRFHHFVGGQCSCKDYW
ncbi:pentatricopeptide repeat-containing protein At4g02750-like [Magnolia sinica]|uniref:pentatricopeptide repeat-containing protein At4g02750-like n=1 Tax=Magnolia sinica TaxID=86752 RepID=UPI00265ABB50|nr:pentatricopeptide repeat-containing protein At4g02750-like [Magnolia sinica]